MTSRSGARRSLVTVAWALAALTCLGGKCQPEFPEQDPEITMMREIMLLNDDVINSVDDFMVETYDGSDESLARLERGVCILETMQDANLLAWKAVRVYELAKIDYERRKAVGDAGATDKADLDDLQEKVLSYVVEVGRIGLQVYNIYVDWGKPPPAGLDKMMKLIGKFIGQEVQDPLPINCSEVVSWSGHRQAA